MAVRSVRFRSCCKGLRERAVRPVAGSRPDHATEWESLRSVAQKLGIGSPDAVRTWVRKAEVDAGAPPRSDQRGVRRAARDCARRAASCAARMRSSRRRASPRPRSTGPQRIDAHADRCTDAGCAGVSSRSAACSPAGTPIFPSTFYNAGGRTWRGSTGTNSARPTSAGCTRRTTTSTALARAGWRSTGRRRRRPVQRGAADARLGLEGVRRGRIRRTTAADPGAAPDDLAQRQDFPP